MADKTIKEPENVPGPYYVDQTCNLCRNCMEEAPNLMNYNDDETYAYFFKQPETPDETRAGGLSDALDWQRRLTIRRFVDQHFSA